jgi:hypothetical protein
LYQINYNIKLNESSRPYIDLLKDSGDKPEDKFYAIEMARYILQDAYSRKSKNMDKNSVSSLENSIDLLYKVGDEVAKILWEQMKTLGDATFFLGKEYHIEVNNSDDLNKLPFFIQYEDKIYEKLDGLKAKVIDENIIYRLVDGEWIINEDKINPNFN